MWVLSSTGTTLIDLNHCSRIIVAERDDAVLVSAVIDRTEKPVTLCKCETMKAAREVMAEIADNIGRDLLIYRAPDNFIDRPLPKVQDARVKRKGGS